MPHPNEAELPVLAPNLQISFYYRLVSIRETYLRDALKRTVSEFDVVDLDRDLNDHVSRKALKRLASFGLRGEVVFPVPLILRENPFLLGYYRLLYGLSQKEFYNKGPFGRFKRLEDSGEIPTQTKSFVPALCRSMAATGAMLVEGLDELSMEIIQELQLLTIGPQLRGRENTRIGETANQAVSDLIAEVVAPFVKDKTRRSIRIENAAGRPVLIEFSSDPDVLVTEKLETGFRYVLSIEVKGGSDASNVHNRLGEAEKSHLKAKRLGCVELWTVLRVDVPPDVAHRASPTTTSFFHLDRILNRRSDEFGEFRQALASRLGIKV